jgi:hypothetical protein
VGELSADQNPATNGPRQKKKRALVLTLPSFRGSVILTHPQLASKHQKETSSRFPNNSGWIMDLKEKRFKLLGGLSPLNIYACQWGSSSHFLDGKSKICRPNNYRLHIPGLDGENPMFKNEFPLVLDKKHRHLQPLQASD